MPGLYEASREDLGDLMAGEPSYRVRQVWEGLYRRVLVPAEMTELPLPLRRRLDESLSPMLNEVERRTADRARTVRWSWSLGDGALIETVLMRYRDRVTACISSQAGCAMRCSFCATGQGGFVRQLSSGEIVEQVAAAIRAARPRRLSNVVLMGMGEPLANYERVIAALMRMRDDMGISARKLTVSTVGIVPGILRLAAEPLPVNLAVSLHAANDDSRNELVPVNRKYPLGILADACAEYVERTGRRLSIEWALIDGVNDRTQDVRELASFARPLRAHVNLIPLNPTPGYPVKGSAPDRVREFRSELELLGINATIRVTRGVEIDAACGQLAAAAASKQAASA